MRIIYSFIIIAILPFFVSKKAPEPDVRYCNARFQFCVEFPDTLLPVQVISDNSDGIILKSKDEKVVATIAGIQGVTSRNTWDLYDDFVGEWMEDEGVKIISENIEQNYYKVSFIDGKNKYWQHLFNMGDKYVIFQIVAPKSEAHQIDKIREHLQLTFNM